MIKSVKDGFRGTMVKGVEGEKLMRSEDGEMIYEEEGKTKLKTEIKHVGIEMREAN